MGQGCRKKIEDLWISFEISAHCYEEYIMITMRYFPQYSVSSRNAKIVPDI
jgi:hypothetical protein